MKVTRKMIEEQLNEFGPPDHDHPENDGRVPWCMVNRYGTWLRRNDPIAFAHAIQDMTQGQQIWGKV